MKLKYYLRGLGVGILLSTIILSIAFRISLKEKLNKLNSKAESQTEVADSSDEIKDLEDLLVPTAPASKDSAETSKEDSKKKDATDNSIEEPSATPLKDNEEAKTDDLSSEETQQDTTSTEQKEEQDDYVIISIEKGMTAKEVASLLYNYGIVEDERDFNIYMKEKDYSRFINIGDFKIPKNATYEQIVDKIIGKK